MKVVGGYENLIKLPIPTFFEILQSLDEKADIEKKEMKGIKKW